MNRHLVARLVGSMLVGIGVTMLAPAGVAAWDRAWSSVQAYLAGGALAVAVGLAMWLLSRRSPGGALGPREAITVVTFTWGLAGLLGGVPLLLDGAVPTTLDALFESVSGFTTTGATVIADLGRVSRASLLWRSISHWLGGMGIIVLFVAVFPQLGVGARHLRASEGPGPITERLRPRLRHTATTLWWIYAAFTAACGLLLWLGGMSLFDAVNHAFATMATGGFSTRNASVGGWDSPFIQAVITVFMIFAGVNFSLYHAAIRGHVRGVFRDAELRAYLGLFLIASAFVTVSILARHGGDFLLALRHATFQVAAIQTTTGFGTDDFDQYPGAARALLFILMFVGGSAGSTAGGMKLSRIMVLLKGCFRELRRTMRPQEVRALRIGQRVIPETTLRSIAGFATLFAIIYVVAVLILTYCGLDLVTAASAAVAALGNIGPGLADVGPTKNYLDLPDLAKIVLTACMLLGRLEVMTVLAVFLPATWRRRS